MPVNEKEIILVATGAAPGGSGTVNNQYFMSTNDTAAAIETDGYFDGAFDNGLNKGDVIIASVDIDGTIDLKMYQVTVGGADVTVASI